jgi:hypothetical protein
MQDELIERRKTYEQDEAAEAQNPDAKLPGQL